MVLKLSSFLNLLRGKEHVMGAVLGAEIIYPNEIGDCSLGTTNSTPTLILLPKPIKF